MGKRKTPQTKNIIIHTEDFVFYYSSKKFGRKFT